MIILSVLLVASFVGVTVWRRRELPESISALVYEFEGAKMWLWSLWMLAVDVLTFAPAIEVLDTRGLAFVAFIPMALLGFVAAMPIFMKEHKLAHDIMGIAAAVFSQVCVVLICPWWLFAWTIFLFLMGSVIIKRDSRLAKIFRGKGVFVAEMICYLTLVGAILIR